MKLNRKQIYKLMRIVEHFKEVQTFDVVASSSSGIGETIEVTFDLFESKDTTVDITDVSEW